MSFWTCVFDIETCSVTELHRRPDFTRLYGYTDQDGTIHTTDDVQQLLWHLDAAPSISGHNVLQFDLLALAKWYRDADWYERMAAKTWDTFLVERHLKPVAAQGMQRNGYYGLDGTCARYGVNGKQDDIKRLARQHGGFDRIPLDDPDYHAYLNGDVAASVALLHRQQSAVAQLLQADRQYIRREHRTQAALTASVSLAGFRVDMDLTMKRYAEGQDRLQAGREKLHAEYGMPLEGKAPHRTLVGKAAFRRAIEGAGVDPVAVDWPLAKDGSLLTGKDVLTPLADSFEAPNPAAADLCRTILAMNGERTVAGTMLDHAVTGPDGEARVYPSVSADQGSGRWSIQNPGLTVLGKRGGKHIERAMLTADQGELLVAIDADQVDARVVAVECQDPEYMKLFLPGMDLHSEVAFRVWPDRTQHGDDCHRGPRQGHDCGVAAKCHCYKRDQAKGNGHGFSYGLSARGMSLSGIPLEDCQRFIHGFTEAFPGLDAWKARTRRLAGALPYGEVAPPGDEYRILRTWAGRPVRVERSRAYTQATALVGQGGTRDVMAHALLSLPVGIRRRVKAVIHDEFVFSLPADRAAELGQKIADRMAFDLKGVWITFGVSEPSFDWSGCY